MPAGRAALKCVADTSEPENYKGNRTLTPAGSDTPMPTNRPPYAPTPDAEPDERQPLERLMREG